MRVSKNDRICGLAVPDARRLMRLYSAERLAQVACHLLGVGEDAARDLMRAFEAAGYIARSELARAAGDDWRLQRRHRPAPDDHADRRLRQLPRSRRRPARRPGSGRIYGAPGPGAERYADEVLGYARASGHSFGTSGERIFWPARELRMILMNRSPAISITHEDIRRLTDRFEIVYAVSDDPGAVMRRTDGNLIGIGC